MSTTTLRTTSSTQTRNVALLVARVIAAVIGGLQLAGFSFFMFVVPDAQLVMLGPWVDYPIVALLLTGVLLKLLVALAPLHPQLRIRVGLAAVAVGLVVTLLKMPLYGEPEGVTFLVLDLLLGWLLLRARRGVDPAPRPGVVRR